MKRVTHIGVALALVIGLACGVFAGAGDANADSFQGSTWTLTNDGLLADLDLSHETYRITLGVDLQGYTGGGSYLDQVALKVSSSIFGADLFAAPGGVSEWDLMSGGINNSGCSGSGGGFECANSVSLTNGGRGVTVGDPNLGIDYFWTFDLTMNNGALFTATTGEDSPSVKARFIDGIWACDNNGNCNYGKVGDLVSEHVPLTTAIPEPEIFAMLAAGLGLMGFVARRRKQQVAAV